MVTVVLFFMCKECKEEIPKYVRYEVSMTVICIYWGQMGIFIPNMNFLCLTLWLGGVCTDNNANDDANDDHAQCSKHDCMRLFV